MFMAVKDRGDPRSPPPIPPVLVAVGKLVRVGVEAIPILVNPEPLVSASLVFGTGRRDAPEAATGTDESIDCCCCCNRT
jgi:hypothetical protein